MHARVCMRALVCGSCYCSTCLCGPSCLRDQTSSPAAGSVLLRCIKNQATVEDPGIQINEFTHVWKYEETRPGSAQPLSVNAAEGQTGLSAADPQLWGTVSRKTMQQSPRMLVRFYFIPCYIIQCVCLSTTNLDPLTVRLTNGVPAHILVGHDGSHTHVAYCYFPEFPV